MVGVRHGISAYRILDFEAGNDLKKGSPRTGIRAGSNGYLRVQ